MEKPLSKRSGIRSILVNSWQLGAARAFASIARAVYALFLARELGAFLYGHFNYGMAWYLALIPLVLMGIPWVLLKEIGTDPSSAPRLVEHSYRICLFAGLLLAMVSSVGAWILEPDPEVRMLLGIFSLALLARGMALWFQAVFTAFEKARYVLALESSFRLAEVFLGIALVLAGFGILTLALLHVATWSLQLVVSRRILQRLVPMTTVPFVFPEVVRILHLGFPFLVANLLGVWISQGSLILYRFQEGLDAQLGYLALSLQAFFILGAIVGELGNAALPVVARSIERGDGKSDHYVQEVLRLGWFLGGTLAILAWGLAEPVITWLLGEAYASVAVLLPWTLAALTFHFWMTALQGMVGVHRHFEVVVLANVAGALLFTLGFLLLQPLLGALGAVASLATGFATVVLFYLFRLARRHHIDWWHRLVAPGLAVAGGMLAAWWLHEQSGLLALMGGFGVLFMVALVTRAVTPAEIRRVLTLIA